MDLKVREIPEEVIPHIETIKRIAKKHGIDEISFYSYAEADLPYETALLKLDYNLPVDIDESLFSEELSRTINIATYVTNINRLSGVFRAYSVQEFFPL